MASTAAKIKLKSFICILIIKFSKVLHGFYFSCLFFQVLPDAFGQQPHRGQWPLVPPHTRNASFSVCLSRPPPSPRGLSAGSKALPTGSRALLACAETLPAGSENLLAGSWALLAGSGARWAGSEALPAGSRVLLVGYPALLPISMILQASSEHHPAESESLPTGLVRALKWVEWAF